MGDVNPDRASDAGYVCSQADTGIDIERRRVDALEPAPRLRAIDKAGDGECGHPDAGHRPCVLHRDMRHTAAKHRPRYHAAVEEGMRAKQAAPSMAGTGA